MKSVNPSPSPATADTAAQLLRREAALAGLRAIRSGAIAGIYDELNVCQRHMVEFVGPTSASATTTPMLRKQTPDAGDVERLNLRLAELREERLRRLHEPDPLDERIDGEMLRSLIAMNTLASQTENPVAEARRRGWTPAQRAAVSAYLSAQLRAKVAITAAADKERDRLQVVVDLED